MYVGDFLIGQRVMLPWSTNSKLGASVSRLVKGQVQAFRASTGTFTTVGITDTSDVSGMAGINFCTIDLSNTFYAAHDDYVIVLNGATIDEEPVNAVLGEFSVMNRSHTRLMVAGTVDTTQFTPTQIEFEAADISTEAANNNLAGRAIYASIGNALIKQVAVVESSVVSAGGKGHFTVPAGAALTAPFANGGRFIIV
jgi:hypothetical protein